MEHWWERRLGTVLICAFHLCELSVLSTPPLGPEQCQQRECDEMRWQCDISYPCAMKGWPKYSEEQTDICESSPISLVFSDATPERADDLPENPPDAPLPTDLEPKLAGLVYALSETLWDISHPSRAAIYCTFDDWSEGFSAAPSFLILVTAFSFIGV